MPQASVSINIDDLVAGLPSSPSHKRSIFKVDHLVDREEHENLHVPKLVSIGPFHHGKDHLQKMEHHKLRYVKLLLQRRNESSADKYVMAIREQAEIARKCYADPIDINNEELENMLFLDGCFIVEFLRKCIFEQLRERGDDLFENRSIFCKLVHDLMLVENQIPFFILEKLFAMTKIENLDHDLISLIKFVFHQNLSIQHVECVMEAGDEAPSCKNVDHLLGLMYNTWCSSFGSAIFGERRKFSGKLELNSATDLWEVGIGLGNLSAILDINSATKLQHHGILFQKHRGSNLLDIKFCDEVIQIPTLVILDNTESILRNLILYEHFISDVHPKYVTDYAFFLQCLMNSTEDVELLRARGILSNMLGDDDMVQCMFKNLTKNTFSSVTFCYADVFGRLNEHCQNHRNKWMAILKRDYFNNPWTILGLYVTIIQIAISIVPIVLDLRGNSKGSSQ